MRHISSYPSVLMLSTVLFPSSIHAQTTESAVGNGGPGVSALHLPRSSVAVVL